MICDYSRLVPLLSAVVSSLVGSPSITNIQIVQVHLYISLVNFWLTDLERWRFLGSLRGREPFTIQVTQQFIQLFRMISCSFQCVALPIILVNSRKRVLFFNSTRFKLKFNNIHLFIIFQDTQRLHAFLLQFYFYPFSLSTHPVTGRKPVTPLSSPITAAVLFARLRTIQRPRQQMRAGRMGQANTMYLCNRYTLSIVQ